MEDGPMGNYSGTFVSFDVVKTQHAIAIAESGRSGEVRFVGEIENTPGEYRSDDQEVGGKAVQGCVLSPSQMGRFQQWLAVL
jgi:hypothetical protein